MSLHHSSNALFSKNHPQKVLNSLNGIKEEAQASALLILWFLGSGKTTLIKELAPYLLRQGEQLKIIVNDVGSLNVDAERLKDYEVTPLTQWCICCKDADSLKDLLLEYKDSDQRIIIEPTGIAAGNDIKKMVKELGMDIRVITLVNVASYGKENKQEKLISDRQKNLADVLALSHSPSFTALEEVKKDLDQKYAGVPLVNVSHLWAGEDITKTGLDYEMLLKASKKQQNPPSFVVNQKLEHANFPTLSIKLSPSFNQKNLRAIFERIGEGLLRAKGVIVLEGSRVNFDYVKGVGLNFGEISNEEPYLNVISDQVLSHELQEMFTQDSLWGEEEQKNYIPEKIIFSKEEVNAAVKTLLEQYAAYEEMYNEKLVLEELYEKEKQELGSKVGALADQITNLDLALAQLGDAMKFDNPLIWLYYKVKAYVGTSKVVGTIDELKKHCERKTDICHRRLDFLNKELIVRYDVDLFDANKVNPDQGVESFLAEHKEIEELSADEEFMKKWAEYEYFMEEDRAAKWKNYLMH